MSPVARFFRQYSRDDPSWISTSVFYDQLCIREVFTTCTSTPFDCAVIALKLVVVGEGQQHERPLCCFLSSDDSHADQLIYIEGEFKCPSASVGFYLFILYDQISSLFQVRFRSIPSDSDICRMGKRNGPSSPPTIFECCYIICEREYPLLRPFRAQCPIS